MLLLMEVSKTATQRNRFLFQTQLFYLDKVITIYFYNNFSTYTSTLSGKLEKVTHFMCSETAKKQDATVVTTVWLKQPFSF